MTKRAVDQAADLIGQLGNLLYLKKVHAHFDEFEEIRLNRQLGYASLADLIERYLDFYSTSVSPHLEGPYRIGVWFESTSLIQT
ncbi:hypothetical protein AA309_18750 [Microvirga vignae]|uniref:Uncharacterized protein n=1 Tax=Microvirga vignae TaxID=1225564 RepID=A0A0H1R9C6_9HYPH|nr:hypothetical protein [Microvirga vignae]KLK91684.1 hypothetical protein AA309_18750 [Microvirga vignae]